MTDSLSIIAFAGNDRVDSFNGQLLDPGDQLATAADGLQQDELPGLAEWVAGFVSAAASQAITRTVAPS